MYNSSTFHIREASSCIEATYKIRIKILMSHAILLLTLKWVLITLQHLRCHLERHIMGVKSV